MVRTVRNILADLALGLGLITLPAQASCLNYQDSDLRNLCLARERGSEAPCLAVRDQIARQTCQAVQEHQSDRCLAISDQRS